MDSLWWQLRYSFPVRMLAALKYRLWPETDWTAGASPAVRRPTGAWVAPALPASMTGPRRFRFAGIERELADNRGWRWKPWGEEWLAQLHAFDDIVSDDAPSRFEWHQSLISNWTLSNQPGKGMGWTPASLPRRVVNWVKFGVGRPEALPEAERRSLQVQVRYMRQRLGNFAKQASVLGVGKSLIFAGAYFEGAEADMWRETGLGMIKSALRNAAAPTALGGQAAVQDVLDLVQLGRLYPGLFPSDEVVRWEQIGRQWVASTLRAGTPHAAPAAAAPTPQALFDYGGRLGLIDRAGN